jgi:hypothetical protein
MPYGTSGRSLASTRSQQTKSARWAKIQRQPPSSKYTSPHPYYRIQTNFLSQDEEFGLGDDAYAAIFDVYHQLHCLNWLRKLIYPDYYPNARNQFPKSVDPERMFEIHMGHCVDLIMQSIQCSGNLNLITMHWVHEEAIPFPDMSINRQCAANFDAITDWRMENQVDVEKYIKISTFTSWGHWTCFLC